MREDTKKAFKESGTTTIFAKKEIKEIEEHLYDDENVLYASCDTFRMVYFDNTNYTVSIGFWFLTNKRIILLYGKSNFVITSLEEIKKIDLVSGNGNHLQIHTEDKVIDYVVSKNFDTANKIYSVFMSAYAPYRTEDSNTESTQNSNIDITEQIEKLSQLKDKGIITEEEFQAKKADLLARL